MTTLDDFNRQIQRQIQRALETQRDIVIQAGKAIADSLSKDGFIYTFGTGHSSLLALELFYRAGGLARVIPMLDESLMLHYKASKSTEMERLTGMASILFEKYRPTKQDCMILISNSGRNTAIVDMALLAKETGITTIALVNKDQSSAWPSRHPSGKKLQDVVDFVLDNCCAEGDALLPIKGLAEKIAPTSTITGSFLLQALMVIVAEQMLERGLCPEFFISSNTNGDSHNQKLIKKYKDRNPHL